MSAHSIEQSQTDRPGRRLTLKLDSVSFQSSPRFLIRASRSSPPNAIRFAMPLISSSTSFVKDGWFRVQAFRAFAFI